jgi:cytochrome c556
MALSSAIAATQSVDEFDAWMRTIEQKTQSVQQNIARRNADAVAIDAKSLEETFRLVEEFWTRRGDAADAVTLSKQAREHAVELLQAASAKDFDRASTEAIRVAETCTSCHRLYRPLP